MSKIIAEIGVNWNGSINTSKDMITKSKLAGADFVKFQLFDTNVIKKSEHYHALSMMMLGKSELRELKSHANSVNIGFIVSCMYPGAFELAESVEPDFIKIRHADRNNGELAKLAIDYCNKMGVKVFVSTGLISDVSDIYTENPMICNLMYCDPKYPPSIMDAVLLIQHHVFLEAEPWRGFSSHYKNVLIPSSIAYLYIEFIEVHVSNYISDIDRNVSLTFRQLKTLCDFNKE